MTKAEKKRKWEEEKEREIEERVSHLESLVLNFCLPDGLGRGFIWGPMSYSP
jgi:hypothetical protein